MNTAVLRALLLVTSTLAVAPGRADAPRGSTSIGGIQLGLGMSREAARGALAVKQDLLVTRMGDSELVVTDTGAMRVLAILTFDRQGRLSRVRKNWTPTSDSALALGLALYDLAAEVSAGEPGTGRRPCMLNASRRAPVGPNAWLRDPGKPDLEIREVRLTCGNEAILIHVRQPAESTKVVEPILRIEKVLLYQSTGEAGDETAGEARTAAPASK